MAPDPGQRTDPKPGHLQVPLGALAVASTCIALACLVVLVVVASINDVDTLSTVALALAIIAFVAQLIVFVVQTSAANQQMLQSRELHSELVRLLGLMGERARGTEAAVSTINERLLEAALGKALGTTGTGGEDAKSIAREVAAMLNVPADTIVAPAPSERSPSPGAVTDIEAHDAAARRLRSFPQDPEAALRVLTALDSNAREGLRRFAQDELTHAGTPLGVGRGSEMPGFDQLLADGLVEAISPGRSIYALSDDGRDVARLLYGEGPYPSAIAEPLAVIRGQQSTGSIVTIRPIGRRWPHTLTGIGDSAV
jgi:hypothetical protein